MKRKLWIMLAAVLLLAVLWCGVAMGDETIDLIEITGYIKANTGMQPLTQNQLSVPEDAHYEICGIT